jgi:phage terminase large subunit-like protein
VSIAAAGRLDRELDTGEEFDGRALVGRLQALPGRDRHRVLAEIGPGSTLPIMRDWRNWAHDGQLPPPGDWRVWLIRAGRGFGKTRAGPEWVSAIARANPKARIALVGGTIEDVRRVMIEGAGGLIACATTEAAPVWLRDKGELTFASGAVAFAFSAEAPEALRGPEHDAAWCDELAKWRFGDAAWDNLMLGLRGCEGARVLVTTTPRPVNLLRRIMAAKGTVETRGGTRDNPHLPAAFVEEMEASYGGTRLGRQELDGELVDELERGLWSRAMLEAARVAAGPAAVRRMVVAVDPPATAGGDACGIVAVGLGADGLAYVIEDASVAGLSPEGWAAAVAGCVARHGADRVVAEKNQGGDMVGSVLRAVDAGLPIALVHASRGKVARAEPVAALYERGRVRHVGAFPALEDELCGLSAGGEYHGPGRSPDRADALVWALTELMLGAASARPGVRVV